MRFFSMTNPSPVGTFASQVVRMVVRAVGAYSEKLLCG